MNVLQASFGAVVVAAGLLCAGCGAHAQNVDSAQPAAAQPERAAPSQPRPAREISPELLRGLKSGPVPLAEQERQSRQATPDLSDGAQSPSTGARPAAPAVSSTRVAGSAIATPGPGMSRAELGTLASLVDGMKPGEWRALPGTIRAVVPSREEIGPFHGTGGPAALPLWSGAAIGGGAFWLWGGGHADYGGNEVYRYDLGVGEWSRFGPWLDHDVDANGCLNPRGAPISAHTAGGLWWAHEKLWVAGYSGYCRSQGTQQGIDKTWSFDPANQSWAAFPALVGVEPHTAYNATDDLVYQWSRRSRLDIYDGTTLKRVATRRGPIDYVPDYANLVFDAEQRVVYGHAEGRVFAWPVDARGRWTQGETVFEKMPSARGGVAVRKGALYFWAGGTNVQRLDPATGKLETLTGEGGPTRVFDRIFSKWLYVPAVDVFLGFSSFDSVFVWKPPLASGAAVARAGAPSTVALDSGARRAADSSSSAAPASTGRAEGAPSVPRASSAPLTWVHDPVSFGGLAHYNPDAVMPGRPSLSNPTVGLDPGMRNTGDRPEIGLVTAWQAALLAGRSEFRDVVLAQASDEVSKRLRWEWEHTYPLYWVPYLLTGDERYLQRKRELWTQYQVDYRRRRHEGPLEPLTEREFAWQLRNLAQLAKADPAYEPILERTRQYVIRHYVEGGRPGRKVLHNLGPERPDDWSQRNKLGMTFWQQAFVGQTLAHVVLLGHEEWRPILEHHFELWRQFGERKLKHVDGGDIFYWSREGGDLDSWDAIIDAYESNPTMRNQPDDQLFANNAGVRHIRGQQALHAIGLAAVAGVPGAKEIHADLKAKIEARARAGRFAMTVRDEVLVP